MTPDVRGFLDFHPVGVLATRAVDGRPRQSLVYFFRDGDRLMISTLTDRLKARDIRRSFGKHPMGYEIPVKKPARELRGLRDRLIAGARTKAELSRWILGARSWDFFLTVLGEAHHGGHTLWPVEGSVGDAVPPHALREVYRAVDDALGVILDALDLSDTTAIIFSPHVRMSPKTI